MQASLGVAAAASLAHRPGRTAPGAMTFDPVSAKDNMHVVARLLGRADGGVTYLHSHGRMFGMRPEEHAVPMLDFESCVARFFRYDEAARHYRMGLREWLFFKEIDTGEIPERYLNPYTHEEVEVAHFRGGGGATHLWTVRGQERVGREEYQVDYGPQTYDWLVDGDDVTISIDKYISFPAFYSPKRFPRASTGPTRWELQVQTLLARRSELENPDVVSPGCREIWFMKNLWMGFLNMGQWSGEHLWKAMGIKYDALERLPEEFLQRTDSIFPGLLDEVSGWEIEI